VTLACLDAGDADDNEKLEITDAIFTLNFLFTGGRAPPPFRVRCFQGCALDLTPDKPLEGEAQNPNLILSCNAYRSCRS
jgi:hypothetical protein